MNFSISQLYFPCVAQWLNFSSCTECFLTAMYLWYLSPITSRGFKWEVFIQWVLSQEWYVGKTNDGDKMGHNKVTTYGVEFYLLCFLFISVFQHCHKDSLLVATQCFYVRILLTTPCILWCPLTRNRRVLNNTIGVS